MLRHLRQAGVPLAYAKLDLYHARMPARGVAPDPDHAAEALLARCELFAALDAADLASLAAATRQRRLPAGAALLRQGEPGSSLLIVVEGVLDVWREPEAAGGRRVWLNAIGAGAMLGEFSLLTGEPRSATVTVKRDALLLEIGREALAPVLERRPELVEALGRSLAERRARSEALTAGPSPDDPAVAGAEHEGRLRQRIRAFFGL